MIFITSYFVTACIYAYRVFFFGATSANIFTACETCEDLSDIKDAYDASVTLYLRTHPKQPSDYRKRTTSVSTLSVTVSPELPARLTIWTVTTSSAPTATNLQGVTTVCRKTLQQY